MHEDLPSQWKRYWQPNTQWKRKVILLVMVDGYLLRLWIVNARKDYVEIVYLYLTECLLAVGVKHRFGCEWLHPWPISWRVHLDPPWHQGSIYPFLTASFFRNSMCTSPVLCLVWWWCARCTVHRSLGRARSTLWMKEMPRTGTSPRQCKYLPTFLCGFNVANQLP